MNYQSFKEKNAAFLTKAYGKWWMMAVEGLSLLIIAGITLFNPEMTLNFLVVALGIYRIAMGIFYLVVSISLRVEYGNAGGFSSIRGIGDLMLGGAMLLWPNFVVGIFMIFISLWAFGIGAYLIISGLRIESASKIPRIVMGGVLVIFGIFAFINPLKQMTTFMFIFGVLLAMMGVYFIVQAFSMRKLFKEVKQIEEGFQDYKVE